VPIIPPEEGSGRETGEGERERKRERGRFKGRVGGGGKGWREGVPVITDMVRTHPCHGVAS